MEMQLVMIRISMRASNILDNIHRVIVEIDVILLVSFRASFNGDNQLIGAIVGNVHVTFSIQDNQISTGIIYGDTPIRFTLRR